MTVRLTKSWNGYAANSVVTLDAATEAALLRDQTASAAISLGNSFVDNPPFDNFGSPIACERIGANPDASAGLNTALITRAMTYGNATINAPGRYRIIDAFPQFGYSLTIGPGVSVETVAGFPPETLRLVRLQPRPLIYDTDTWTDVDDLFGQRVLTWGEAAEKITIVGCMTPRTALNPAILDAMFCADGRRGVPIGINSTAGDFGGVFSFRNTLSARYHDVGHPTTCESDVSLYRRIFAAATDYVDILLTGYCQSLSAFLDSPADSISPLTGVQLASLRGGHLWLFGGDWPTGSENNFTRSAQARASAVNVVAKWPRAITFLNTTTGDTVLPCPSLMASSRDVGKVYLAPPLFTVAAAVANAGNVGNGTVTAVSAGTGCQDGTYSITVAFAILNSGTFNVRDPFGVSIGVGTVGTPFTGQINFTVNDGSTDFSMGDSFTIVCTSDPLKVAGDEYNAANGFALGTVRPGWGAVGSLIAINGNLSQTGYSSIYGTGAVNPGTGANTWTNGEAGAHRYTLKVNADTNIVSELDVIIMKKDWPRRKGYNANFPVVVSRLPRAVVAYDQANLVAWWNADDLQDLTNGDNVPHWEDRIGRWHLRNTTGTAVPTYASAQYSKRAVAFNSSRLITDPFYSQPIMTVYVQAAYAAAPAGTNQSLIVSDSTVSNTPRRKWIGRSWLNSASAVSLARFYTTGGSADVDNRASTITTGVYNVYTFRMNVTQIESLFNNLTDGSTTVTGAATAQQYDQPIHVGSLSPSGAVTEGMVGWIRDIRVYFADHDTTQRAAVIADMT